MLLLYHTSHRIDWSTLTGEETGWVYLGQAKLTSAASSLIFTFPKKYYNYKILACGECATGTGAVGQIQFLNDSSTIACMWNVYNLGSTTMNYGEYNNTTYQGNWVMDQYDNFNIEMLSLKSLLSQYRKFQVMIDKAGSYSQQRRHSGRCLSATEPTAVQITLTNGTLAVGGFIRVWGSTAQ